MTDKKSNNQWIYALIILILVGNIALINAYLAHPTWFTQKRPYRETMYAEWGDIRRSLFGLNLKLAEAANKKYITAEDLPYLDFFHGDPDRGWKSGSPNILHYVHRNNYYLFITGTPEAELLRWNIDEISAPKKGRLKINLRRYPYGVAGSVDSLMLMVTNVNEKYCTNHGGVKPLTVEVLPDNHTVAIDKQAIFGCARTVNGELVLALPFFQRIRQSDSDPWYLNIPRVAN